MHHIDSSLGRATRSVAIVTVAVVALTASAASAQSPLGSAQSFAVLGASTVTNTGATVVTGDVGVSPGTAITGFNPPGVVLAGAIHAGDSLAARAHTDAVIAYARLAALACPSINHLSGVLGQGSLTALPAGVYCFDTSAQLTGTLTLTGAGPWVFQIGTTLTTASNANVVTIDAAPNCSGSNVFWQLGTSATLGTGTQFAGHVLALASITATGGVSVHGSLLALAGAVTMDTNQVLVCSAASAPLPPIMDKCEADDDRDLDRDKRDHRGKADDDHHKGGDRNDKDGESKDKKRS